MTFAMITSVLVLSLIFSSSAEEIYTSLEDENERAFEMDDTHFQIKTLEKELLELHTPQEVTFPVNTNGMFGFSNFEPPKIDFPSFDGSFENLSSFHESFKILADPNPHLKQVEKHQDEDSSTCTLKDNTEGICISIKNCTSAQNEIKNKRNPQLCRLEGYDPIVCCEKVSKRVMVGSKSEAICKEMYYVSGPYGRGGVGGRKASPREFRHMAVLGFGTEDDIIWGCGGSLISLNFVLTAAHCLANQNLGQVKFVRLGDLDLQATDDDALPQNFKVINRIRHPKYNPPMKYNDIALVELDRPAEYSSFVEPACLHITKEIPDVKWIATGWGTLFYGGPQANHLQALDLKKHDYDVCRKSYKISARRLPRGIEEDTQICAGEKGRDTCDGDSGGPLQIDNAFKGSYFGFTIIGVTSFGKDCGITNSSGVYTRVSYYIDWIESIVWPN